MLIKEFCEATGLPRDTVRLYVRRGLLKPDIGSAQSNRYQVFDDAQIERARTIKMAQALGFSLREIAQIGAAYDRDGLAAADRAEIIRARLEALDEQAGMLSAMRGYLAQKLAWIEAGEQGTLPALGSPRGRNGSRRSYRKWPPKARSASTAS